MNSAIISARWRVITSSRTAAKKVSKELRSAARRRTSSCCSCAWWWITIHRLCFLNFNFAPPQPNWYLEGTIAIGILKGHQIWILFIIEWKSSSPWDTSILNILQLKFVNLYDIHKSQLKLYNIDTEYSRKRNALDPHFSKRSVGVNPCVYDCIQYIEF
jgi:hypothetical protein